MLARAAACSVATGAGGLATWSRHYKDTKTREGETWTRHLQRGEPRQRNRKQCINSGEDAGGMPYRSTAAPVCGQQDANDDVEDEAEGVEPEARARLPCHLRLHEQPLLADPAVDVCSIRLQQRLRRCQVQARTNKCNATGGQRQRAVLTLDDLRYSKPAQNCNGTELGNEMQAMCRDVTVNTAR